MWVVGEGASFMISEEIPSTEATQSAVSEKPVTKKISGDSFKDVPAFQFLDMIGLTVLPNVPGTGIGIHHTTNTWQIRYPAANQKSVARTFGNCKKGYVSPVRALLQCLLWAWQQHGKENLSCAVTLERIQVIEGALKVNLGHDVEIVA